MLAGDPHPQDGGPDAEAKGGGENQRLAVDAGGDRAFGADLERRGPTTHAMVSAVLSPRPVGAAAIVIPSRPSSMCGRVPDPTAMPSR